MTTKSSKTFLSALEYLWFEKTVKSEFRYVRDTRTNEFLDAVLLTSKNRKESINKDQTYWRSQLGSSKSGGIKYETTRLFQEDVPYPVERMKPSVDKAKEGRSNPKGIPYLYLTSEKQTAIQEVRPWIGSLISVAEFQIVKDLKIIDCSRNIHKLDGSSSDSLFPNVDDCKSRKLSNGEIEKYVWSWIDWAFSRPVDPSDDKADYIPTQILAELFKSNGYDGIIYNSLFAEGKNLTLFDINNAKPLNCRLYRITNIPQYEFQEVKRLSDTLLGTGLGQMGRNGECTS